VEINQKVEEISLGEKSLSFSSYMELCCKYCPAEITCGTIFFSLLIQGNFDISTALDNNSLFNIAKEERGRSRQGVPRLLADPVATRAKKS